MAVYLPTLKQLQYLVALRDTGHFGRAADACFVTQSTLSAGLRELESLFRFDAFDGCRFYKTTGKCRYRAENLLGIVLRISLVDQRWVELDDVDRETLQIRQR